MDGMYWHENSDNTSLKQHECLEKGIILIGIYEQDWRDRAGACRNLIRNIIDEKRQISDYCIKDLTYTEGLSLYTSYSVLNEASSTDNFIGLFSSKDVLLQLIRYKEDCIYENIEIQSTLNGTSTLLEYLSCIKTILVDNRLYTAQIKEYEKLGYKQNQCILPREFVLDYHKRQYNLYDCGKTLLTK